LQLRGLPGFCAANGEDVRALIRKARQAAAQAVSAALVLPYSQVGRRIRTDILREQRAAYGEQILPTLSARLVPDFRTGFSARNLARMVQFAEAFPDQGIVAGLARKLSWSHLVEIIALRDPLQREFCPGTEEQDSRFLALLKEAWHRVPARSGLSTDHAGVQAVAEAFGYTPDELASIPAAANMGLSCGNPTATANLRPGEVVVDLGCGGGLDVFLAAAKVWPGERRP
jgi:hypothetical protein